MCVEKSGSLNSFIISKFWTGIKYSKTRTHSGPVDKGFVRSGMEHRYNESFGTYIFNRYNGV